MGDGTGSGASSLHAGVARITILTCDDGWFPKAWRVVSLRGAEIVVWINGRFGTVEDYLVRSALFWNEIHMVTANQAYGADQSEQVAGIDWNGWPESFGTTGRLPSEQEGGIVGIRSASAKSALMNQILQFSRRYSV